MSKFCQKCNVNRQANFCPECGQKTIEKISGLCGCGFQNPPQAKFCGNCGKTQVVTTPISHVAPRSSGVVVEETSFRPSQVKSGAVQVTGLQEFQMNTSGRLSEVQTPEERLEALSKEEERMNKKLGTFNAPSGVVYGGLQSAYVVQPVHQPVHQPVEKLVTSAPIYAPVKQQPVQAAQPQRFDVTEETVQEVTPLSSNNALSFEMLGNPQATSENPNLQWRQAQNILVFSALPGRNAFRVECDVEGSNVLVCKVQTTRGGSLIKKFTIPFQFSRQNLRVVGTSIELNSAI